MTKIRPSAPVCLNPIFRVTVAATGLLLLGACGDSSGQQTWDLSEDLDAELSDYDAGGRPDASGGPDVGTDSDVADPDRYTDGGDIDTDMGSAADIGGVDDGGDPDECFVGALGNRSYRFCTEATTWNEAVDACRAFGDFELVTVDDAFENAWLVREANTHLASAWWIGFTDFAQRGQWTWVGGAATSFVGWDFGEPNNVGGREHCAAFRGRADGSWNDVPCTELFPFICEQNPPPAQATVAPGYVHTCAILSDGSTRCWGSSDYGELGLGTMATRGDTAGEMGSNLPALDLGSGRVAVQLHARSHHTCARLDDGNVKCWGSNAHGQLGIGDVLTRGDQDGEMGDNLPSVDLGTGRTAVSIATGAHHNCAILDDGSAKCWGDNTFGELGVGDTVKRGDNPGELGDNLPAVSLGTGRTARGLVARLDHTCALLDDGTLKCWGNNGYGQLGVGGTGSRGDGPGEMGDALPGVDLGTGRTALAAAVGGYHTCALLDNGLVKCWGQNDGRLGLGDSRSRGILATDMGDQLPAVALGTGRTANAITSGLNHTCALLDDASVKCWGFNESGQLGLGDVALRGDSPAHMNDALPAIRLGTGRTAVAVEAGVYHTCAVLDDDSVKCWGNNSSAQLGLGDTVSRGATPGSMGDGLPAIDLTR